MKAFIIINFTLTIHTRADIINLSFQILPDSLGFCQLFVDCSLETCLQRNRRRDPPLPDGTILLMAEKIQVPNPEKNPWEKNSIMLRNGEDNPEVEDLLCMALENPVREFQENTAAEKDADRAVCAASLLHQADQALRKIISETMRMAKENVPAKGMKTLAEELGKLKCQSLDDLRHGRFLDPASEHHGSDVQDTVARFLQKTDGLLQEYIGSPQ
ncbi:L-seryl-tRNA(Sec) kinase-like isoform X1 [Rhinatrema bivittatum]|uniref:L-seryl-tRNA(Sec) kinase-like isoform X1 n=1 Tax=Rhinatrema bivittatum TaxID=194408 RepID=UPI001126630B|nr:L-seryl-tRNA(Sec) kinase-like isoform X1 [Rhinatrema bivittatum]